MKRFIVNNHSLILSYVKFFYFSGETRHAKPISLQINWISIKFRKKKIDASIARAIIEIVF